MELGNVTVGDELVRKDGQRATVVDFYPVEDGKTKKRETLLVMKDSAGHTFLEMADDCRRPGATS
jgi:hypothetical protein